MPNGEQQQAKTAPYVPFKTFLNAVEMLSPVAPDRVERSQWGSFSGAIQSQVMVAFKFFGLVDDTGRTTQALHTLVESADERKAQIRELMKRSYGHVMNIDLAKASAKTVDEAITQFNVTGDTLRRAVTFFVQAATFADIPLSPYITQRKNRGTKRKPRARGNGDDRTDALVGNAIEEPQAPKQGFTKSTKLSSNGTITLTIGFDPFMISQSDRDFVFSLIDTLTGYEDKEKRSQQPQTAQTPKFRATSAPAMDIADEDVPF